MNFLGTFEVIIANGARKTTTRVIKAKRFNTILPHAKIVL